MLPMSLSMSDASSLAANPVAGLLGGGFVFGGARQLGGTGNKFDSTQSPTATLTPSSGGAPASTPYADGPFGFGGGASASSSSLLMPALIVAGALVLIAVIRK